VVDLAVVAAAPEADEPRAHESMGINEHRINRNQDREDTKMNTIMNWMRSGVALVIVAALAVVMAASAAFALDRVTLNNGEVYEGTILRETDSAIWMKRRVGTVEFEAFVLKEDVASIERDVEVPGEAIPRRDAGPDRQRLREAVASGATKVAFITLGEKETNKEMVGMYIFADALRDSMKALLELPKEEQPDIVVLIVDSGGGYTAETQPLSDVIHLEMKKHFRVVVWVESAISAASFISFNAEEIYMRPEGHIGGTVQYIMDRSGARASEGRELLEVLALGEVISKRGRRDPLIMRAMQMTNLLTADVNERTGEVKFYDGAGGQHVVSPEGENLTLNALDADFYGISKGTASTKDELAKLMGLSEWIEVGHVADQIQRRFRDNVKTAEVRTNEILQKYSIAVASAANARGSDRQREIGIARRYLRELRSVINRAPSFKQYNRITDEWFRQQEQMLRDMMR
jgi:hypothetical protein